MFDAEVFDVLDSAFSIGDAFSFSSNSCIAASFSCFLKRSPGVMPSLDINLASNFEVEGGVESGKGPGGSSARSFAPNAAFSARFSADKTLFLNFRAASKAVKFGAWVDPGEGSFPFNSPRGADLTSPPDILTDVSMCVRHPRCVATHHVDAMRCEDRAATVTLSNVQK